jgi:hypothetical protein
MSPEAPPVGADAETVLVPYALVPNDVVVNALIDPVVIATPDIVPPVTAMLFAFCVDIVPKEPVAVETALVTNAVVANNAAAVAAAPSGRNRRSRRRSGGALGYAPFPSPGMLLSSPKAYAEAGLNPEWKTDVAFTDAKIRETQ